MNKSNQMESLSSCDLIDAKIEGHQLCRSKQCPGCGHKLEQKPLHDLGLDWVGLPAGVKFDPTDQELIEHLEAKVEGKSSKSHPLIDEFIPTVGGEDGICYTHPEKLPGVTRDGLSKHFFHRPSKAYTTGTRKRRKIQTECDLEGGETRWHKTGKTRAVMAKGKQRGCKKILVLYTNFGKNRKPEKTNWVMHQYHLGQHEGEREGELVVSKIFYQTQPRQSNWSDQRASVSVAAAAAAAAGETNNDRKSRMDGGNGSCSSMEILAPQTAGEFSAAAADYCAIHPIHQSKADYCSFLPFRKPFDDEAGNFIGEASTAREAQAAAGTCEFSAVSQHHVSDEPPQQIAAEAIFHNISRPSHSISTIVSPSLPLHNASVILDENHSFHLPRIMLPHHNFQQQHHNFRSASSGLEELIMGCTSANAKQETSIANPQEAAEWLTYPTFWPEPDDVPDNH